MTDNTFFPAQNLLTEKQVSALLNLSVPTLRRRRLLKQKPTFCKMGGAVRYDVRDIEKFIEDGKRN